ncbi:tRNA isopentenyltransferase [Cucurbitaria berberidis CBS 394.84]|uniref:tRNA dimethylallyltransferase n=1 Tax=Cucurbitaria berberidis CBS 394.84 TaxID=1168544 RepID=A0A9P4GMG5_9PLEO|nr:tRNA isopentenyltransferase [Cucurbitaria berberidis CBS 394.84]KAF1847751.1 tRNA isopentenyltransferase [Cucurbitaria berberidis CBS 394.84]
MAQAPAKPLVAIVGATGTGKSDLAVDIARKFNGEIINGDAMQLYRGLPIITNKLTQEEMRGVPHHLLGCVGLEEATWTVGKFVGEALDVIGDIQRRGKLPILVGGTHYYTQSLLFQDALADEPTLNLNENSEPLPILEAPTDVILARLREVDPVMADRWHPNERRKIQRSLEIYLRTGKPASQVYDEQRIRQDGSPRLAQDGPASTHPGLRFPTLVFWVHANKDVLHPRLDGRVEKMLNKGLLSEVQELCDFQKSYESRTDTKIDQSRGIWVSIGYKEFRDYQDALAQVPQVPSELAKLMTASVEKTQAATRQYANRQIKWIRIKLLNALLSAGQKSNIFLLDGSNLSKWEDEVTQTAATVTERFLSGQTLPEPSTLSSFAAEMLTPKRAYDLAKRPDLWQKRVCETCGTVAVTENDWTLHTKSRAHRKAVGARKKRENTQGTPQENQKALQADTDDMREGCAESLP